MIRPNNPPSPGRGPKRSRSPRRRTSKKSGCPLALLTWVLLLGPLAAVGIWALAYIAGQLVALALAAAVT